MSEIDLSVLDQAETWTDAAGTVHQIAEMEPRYCRNVVAFLQRRADEIADVVGQSLVRVRLPDEHTQAYRDVMFSNYGEDEQMAADPIAWLNQKPLIKALSQRAVEGD